MQKGYDVIDNKWKLFKYSSGYSPQITRPLVDKVDLYSTLERSKEDNNIFKKHTRYENILTKTLSKVLPPSLLIDENDNILQILGEVQPYLSIQVGRFSNNFNSNMSRELALFVNNCIRRLKTDANDVFLKNVMNINGDSIDIKGSVTETDMHKFYLVSFVKNSDYHINQEFVEINMTEEVKERVKQLENELQLAREGLQATIEELETSNEELQSSNEELIASNEELQSTNEELQSVNEELFTVNSEYQQKIEELSAMTNDLSNLLKNTEVGALYLDSKLCIRKITPIMSSVTNIMESDIGRPIHHLSVMKSYPDMLLDIESVMDTLQSVEREISDHNDNYWLIRIRPYRTEYNSIDGVILTIVDITNLHNSTTAISDLTQRLHASLASSKIAWWEYNLLTNQVIYSDLKATMLGYTVDEFPNNVYEICSLIHPDDYDRAMEEMKNYITGQSSEWNIFYRIRAKDGSYKSFHDKGTIVERVDGNPTRLIGTVVDVTDIKNYLRNWNE